ncbi:F-box/LRR-repeat protein 4 [Forsythia ovata]|uniref:F-box/LRR-repeat protein 4 n=1 Tax=Forsythia ovata TaxID=205694 RepID=A0ABD1V0G0_9LAMI
MGKPPLFFTNLRLRKSLKPVQNANPQIRIPNRNHCNNRTDGKYEEFGSNSQNPDVFLAQQISKFIQTRPRWEQTLLSDIPGVNFMDPNVYNEVLKQQKNVLLSGCYVVDNGLVAVGKYFNRFEDLNMRFCEGLTDVGLDRLALGCGRTLKSLEVAASAKITDVSLEAVGSYCRSLVTFSLESEFICNKGLLAVAKGYPLLISLELLCSKMTDEALQAITTFCPVLQFLSFCGSNYFTDKSVFFVSGNLL